MKYFIIITVLITFRLLFLFASPKSEFDSNLTAEFKESYLSSVEDVIDENDHSMLEIASNVHGCFKSEFDDEYYSLASTSDSEEAAKDDEFKVSAKWTLKSLKIVFAESYDEIHLRAAVMLFYGINADHYFHSTAMDYIATCYKIEYQNFDPNSMYSSYAHKLFDGEEFDTGSLIFKHFCEYVFYHEMPKTSPLYAGKIPISFRNKWQLQRKALLDFASVEIIHIFNRIDPNQFKEDINLDKEDEENSDIEMVINMLTSNVSEFLSSAVKQDGNFTQKLESFIWFIIVDACVQCNISDKAVHIKIEEELKAKILPTLDLIFNYNDPNKIYQIVDLSYSYFIF